MDLNSMASTCGGALQCLCLRPQGISGIQTEEQQVMTLTMAYAAQTHPVLLPALCEEPVTQAWGGSSCMKGHIPPPLCKSLPDRPAVPSSQACLLLLLQPAEEDRGPKGCIFDVPV